MTSSHLHNGRALLGQRVRDVRRNLKKTLKEVAELTGLSKSTLSKIENGMLSVSYDNLFKLAQALSIDLSTLFAEGHDEPGAQISGRRTVTRKGCGEIYTTPMYRYEWLCADLNAKKFSPIVATLRAHSISSAKDLIRHPGEEFAFVLEGTVEVRSEFYGPIVLTAGDSIYFDSMMAHALISAGEKDARVLWVVTNVSPPADAPSSRLPTKTKTSVGRR